MKTQFLLLITISTCVSLIGQESLTLHISNDANEYEVAEFGDQIWMAENLRSTISGSFVYDDKPGNEDIYGRLYQWDAAMVACPEGWRLPAAEDWDQLIEYFGGVSLAGKFLVQEGREDGSGFALTGFYSIPSGSRDPHGNYNNVEQFGFYWTATEGDSLTAMRRIIGDGATSIGGGYGNKASSYSVRCVKDK